MNETEGIYIGKASGNEAVKLLKEYKSNNEENVFSLGTVGKGMGFRSISYNLTLHENYPDLIILDPKAEF